MKNQTATATRQAYEPCYSQAGLSKQPQLQRVTWAGELRGPLLTAHVVQYFVNPSAQPVELIYNFPLPLGARLLKVEVQLGDRWLEGRVVAAAQATQTYEDALTDGNRSVLLEQRDDASYSLSLGNLESGQTCAIHMHYAEVLPRRQGALRLCVPTMIAPKYGSELAAGLQPYQVAPHSLLVEQAFEFKLCLHGELAMAAVASPTHRLSVRPGSLDHPMEVGLATKAWLDRDLVIVLDHLAAGALVVASAPVNESTQSVLGLLEVPEPAAVPAVVAVKLLVDCSGSMAGDRIASARASVHALLEELRSDDRVMLAQFGDSVRTRSRGLWRLTDASRTAATRWALGLQADMGGTEMEEALSTVFGANASPETRADVLLLTDGDIHAVDQTVKRARRSGHRVFVIGIGLSPSEVLVRRLADETGGACEFVNDAADVPEALRRTVRRMRAPRRSALQWRFPEACQVEWCSEAPLSVFPGDQVVLAAQVRPIPAASTVAGLWAGDELVADVPLLSGDAVFTAAGESVETWVSAQRVQSLLAQSRFASEDEQSEVLADALRAEAKALALRHQLISGECSYVLVDALADAERHVQMPAQYVVPAMLVADETPSYSLRVNPSVDVENDMPFGDTQQPALDVSMSTRSLASPFRYSRARSKQDSLSSTSTPSRLRARLVQTQVKEWPKDFEALRDWGVSEEVLDWLELVAMPALAIRADSLVEAFLVWVAGRSGAASLTWWQKLLPSQRSSTTGFSPERARLQAFFDAQFHDWHDEEWPLVITQLTLQAG